MAGKQLKGMTQERAERAAKVVDLYDTGTSFDKIAEMLGISRTQARNDYRDAIDAIYAETVQEKVGKVERNYLRLMNAWWGPAIGVDPTQEDPRPNPKAADIVMGVLKGYRELFGLDKAIKMEVSSTAATDFASLLGAIRGGTSDGEDNGHDMSAHPGPDLSDDAAKLPEEEA